MTRLEQIRDGRTDLVFEHLAAGQPATASDAEGVPLVRWCAYYGDVSALRHLVSQGAALATLGENLDLNGAAFHGHWQLCEYLIEQGASATHALPDTGETALHAALARREMRGQTQVLRVLLAAGAKVQAATRPGVETGAYMRDARTRGETALHRAAAAGTLESIELLLQAGARRETTDAHGDTPLSWASWHQRPVEILRALCFGTHRIHAQHAPMDANLVGRPLPG